VQSAISLHHALTVLILEVLANGRVLLVKLTQVSNQEIGMTITSHVPIT